MIITEMSDWRRLTDADRHALLAGPDSALWVERLARYGFPEAQLLFGQLLLDRVPKPAPGIAYGWIAATASAGHPPAINLKGRCLEHGWDVAADPVAAVACYRRAADAGYDWAEFNLGCALLYGIGTARDRPAAFDWFTRAAIQGLAKAHNMLGRFHEGGWDRPASRQRAALHYRQAAEGGDFRGQFNLASVLHGQGRVAEALALLRLALRTGSPDFLAETRDLLADNDDPALRTVAAEAARRLARA